jgi:hypothetical protein
VAAKGGIGQFRLISAPDEHPPCLVALAIPVERHREAAVEQLDGDHELIVTVMPRQRLLDELTVHPAPLEVAGDPLVAPAVEQTPILGKALRITRVVDQPLSRDRGNHIVDHIRLNLPPLEERTKLLLRALPRIQSVERRFESALVIHPLGLGGLGFVLDDDAVFVDRDGVRNRNGAAGIGSHTEGVVDLGLQLLCDLGVLA